MLSLVYFYCHEIQSLSFRCYVDYFIITVAKLLLSYIEFLKLPICVFVCKPIFSVLYHARKLNFSVELFPEITFDLVNFTLALGECLYFHCHQVIVLLLLSSCRIDNLFLQKLLFLHFV